MVTNCPNRRCRFFVDPRANACPACGRPVLWPPGWREVALVCGAFALMLALWPVFGARLALALGLVSVVSVAAALCAVRHGDLLRHRTLDRRYDEAVDRAAESSRRWQRLFEQRAMAATGGEAACGELDALRAALDAASEAETTWSERRNRLGATYVDNALDQLSYLAIAYRRDHGPHWFAACIDAVELVDRRLDAVWIDHRYRTWAQREVEAFRRFVSRAELAEELGSISLIELPSPPLPQLTAIGRVGLDLHDDVDDDIVFHRARLAAELDLWRR